MDTSKQSFVLREEVRNSVCAVYGEDWDDEDPATVVLYYMSTKNSLVLWKACTCTMVLVS